MDHKDVPLVRSTFQLRLVLGVDAGLKSKKEMGSLPNEVRLTDEGAKRGRPARQRWRVRMKMLLSVVLEIRPGKRASTGQHFKRHYTKRVNVCCACARKWAERQRLIAAGVIRSGPYTVASAISDYLVEAAAEKKPTAVQGAKYVFDAWVLPELGSIEVEKLTTDQLIRWRNKVATAPKRVRTKRTAAKPATRETPDDDDARRARKATANRITAMLKAALNRAFFADRVSSDMITRPSVVYLRSLPAGSLSLCVAFPARA